MKRWSLLIVMITAIIGSSAADSHPGTAEIQAYIGRNPLDAIFVEIESGLRDESVNLNRQGFELYVQKKYDAALEKFKQAISADDNNSIAYYNAACVMALQYPAIPGDAYDARTELSLAIVRYLKQAIERHWCWALQMMADPDLDSVKYFSGVYGNYYADQMKVYLSRDYEWGNVYNRLNLDGTVTNYTDRGDYGDADMGNGYYCIIGGYVFEYMRFSQEGIGRPPEENAVYFFSVRDFLPASYFER